MTRVDDLLPPPEPPGRPAPWRALSLLLVPAAAFAAATGLQRLFDHGPAGDALVRWMLWATAAGAATGALAGRALGPRLLWTLYGLAAPWGVAALVLGGVQALRPVGEALADRREARCREAGRRLCTEQEFGAACANNDRALLGAPRSASCGPQGCTARWIYDGPFRPEISARTGAIVCNVVTDARGRPLRHLLFAQELPLD